MANAQSLELFFIDGRPDGMVTAEVFNWTGHVLMVPRTSLVTALQRREASYTGVYLLLGDQDGEPWLYIGEGEDISERIRNHDTRKDWWTTAVLIVSSANSLNKAHVRYLEARLVEQAQTVGRVTLQNGNNPARPSLSEAARANMETFLENILMVLPAVRVDCFLERKRTHSESRASEPATVSETKFEIFLKKENIRATAVLRNDEFIVEKGSMARLDWIGDRTNQTSYWRLYDELVKDGTLAVNGTTRIFTSDYKFGSTSAAGAVINGRSTAGPTTWKLAGTDRTYRDWEASVLASQSIS